MTETPQTHDESEHNAYQVAPENPGDEKGYDTAKPSSSDEGYTAENVLERKGEHSPWGRTAEGSKGDHPDK